MAEMIRYGGVRGSGGETGSITTMSKCELGRRGSKR
jgi:hypothetical protein